MPTVQKSISKTVRRIVNPNKYEYKTLDDLKYLSSENILLNIDPNKVDPEILENNLKNNPNPINPLANDQRKALRKLLAIREISKSFAKGPTRDKYVAKMKAISWNELNPDSEFNREVNKVISEAKHDVEFLTDMKKRLTALKSNSPKDEFIENIKERLTELKKPISKTPRRGGRKGGRKTRKLR
jgi:hypothetical protein